MARTTLLVLLAAAAAEDCVVDEIDIARIHATDDDAAAEATLAEETHPLATHRTSIHMCL